MIFNKCLINGCWKNLYPESVQHVFEEFNMNAVHKEIVNLANAAGFTEVQDDDDDDDLLDSHSHPLNNEELAKLEQLIMEETKS
jgi:hypothetical protein